MPWTPEEVLAAVRSALVVEGSFSNWTYERADLEGTDVLVVFRVKATAPVRADLGDGERFGVLYPLDDLPNGPNTGIPWDTVERWAEEIAWDLDEQVDTGLIARAERTPRPPHLVLLRWR
jgi:hypothetical protein